MKKALLMAIVILVACILSSPVIAANKPPKSICYEIIADGYGTDFLAGETLVLAFKKSGMKIRDMSKRKTFYAVNGLIYRSGPQLWYRLTGSGLWNDTVERFEGDFSSNYNTGTMSCLFRVLHESSNDMLRCRITNNVSSSSDEHNLNEIDCRSLDIQ